MTYGKGGLLGTGTIAGVSVRCLSVEMQFRGHTGYELPERQIPDPELLRERFGVEACPAGERGLDAALRMREVRIYPATRGTERIRGSTCVGASHLGRPPSWRGATPVLPRRRLP
jgi:hypothetical protein